MSPELFDPEIQEYRQTKYSDCYAFGMVTYEVLSGRIPFYQHRNVVIPGKVVRGDRPERPHGMEGAWFKDDVWGILERCWAPLPGNRPNIKDVLQCLEEASRSRTPSSQRSLTVPSTDGPLVQGSPDTATAESTDGSGVYSLFRAALSRPAEKQEYMGIVYRVCWATLLGDF